MKRIKIILESKYTLLFVLVLTCILSFIIYHKEINPFIDNTYIIKHIKIKANKVSIISDNVLINYYVDTLEELDYVKNTYKVGDLIEVEGVYSVPSTNTNFNLFNYNLYLKSKKIYYINKASTIKLISHSNNIFYKIKNKIIDRINNYSKNEYLYAFILGDTNYIDNDIKTSFQNNGISHLFAVSGMHVTLLSVLILGILNKIKKSNINYIFVILFLLFYTFLTNYTPSIMRSTLMFILLYINKITKLNIKTSYLFIYLVCGFIIYNPYYIHNVGFLFSFSITYFLIIFGSISNKYHNYFIKLFITSLISFLASIPILINNFFSINILSPFINLLFVPFISFIVFPLSLLTFILPILSPILEICLNTLEILSTFISKYSMNIILCHIPFYIVILYYIVIIFVLYNMKKGRYKYLLILVILLLIHTNSFNLNDEVHMIDVGQGDSILLRFKYNKAILIDTGGTVSYGEEWKQNNYSLAINTIIPYLKSLGIKKLDYLILTHGDYDHMGEAINLVENFKVEKVIFNCGEYNNLEKDLINVLDKKKIPYYSCIKELNINKSKLYFLQTKEYDNENDNSNVIYTEIDGYKFMFMGDAGVDKEEDVLEKYNISNIDVLKVGHHGSKTSSSKEFINKMNPKYSIISVGKNNRYGHPNKEVLNNLDNSKIYRTDEEGSIMFKIKKNKLQIETCSP
ncbi:MAG: DNA internalization-related competence protein ComEC/Rec2 [Bacilli bacterium]|nr:DNA internalization-related competence protein ComEC/Rec2 [Bacilli bacterium]